MSFPITELAMQLPHMDVDSRSAPVTPHTSPKKGAKRGVDTTPSFDVDVSMAALSRISCPGAISTALDSPIRRLAVKSPTTSPEKKVAVAEHGSNRPMPAVRLKLNVEDLPPLPFGFPQIPVCQSSSSPTKPASAKDPFVDALLACDFDRFKKELDSIEPKKILKHLQDKHKALKDGSEEKALLGRILVYYRGFRNDLDEKKKLNALDALRISLFVEKKLQHGLVAPEYIPEGTEGIKRAIIFQGKTFYILSGKYSEFQAEGEERRIANATQFCLAESVTINPRKFVHIENILDGRGRDESRREVEAMKKQAELAEKINNDIHAMAFTTQRGMSQIVVIEDKYAHTLDDFRIASTHKKPLSLLQLHQVLVVVGQKLLWLHTNGYVHGDIKKHNILLDFQKDGSLHIKLTDFGYTYTNTADFPMAKQLQTTYGTSAYTAPEYFQRKAGSWTVTQGKCHDMFSLGCLLYELLFNVETLPWASEVLRKLENQGQLQQAYASLVTETTGCADAERKKLLEICVGLLHPDPQKRMTVEQFLQSLK